MCQENRELVLFKSSERTSEITIDPATNESVKVDKIKESWYCWEDLVQSKWHILEQIRDLNVHQRTSGPRDLPRLKTVLEGFEFEDIVSEETPIRPRMTHIQSAAGEWVELVAQQDKTVIIFGSGFGDLITPNTPKDRVHSNCSRYEGVPKGKDYLAAPIYVLYDIASQHQRPDALWLGRSIYWSDSEKCFSQCPCGEPSQHTKCLPAVAKLQSSKIFRRKCAAPPLAFLDEHRGGAVLFGEKAKTPQNRLTKRPLNSDDVPVRNTKPRISDSGVGFVSSHSSYGNGKCQKSPYDDSKSFKAHLGCDAEPSMQFNIEIVD